MSITGPVPDEHGIIVTAIGRACTYCERPTQDPAVAWSGPNGIEVVHAECVAVWFLRMGRDAHEILNPGYYARRFRGRA